MQLWEVNGSTKKIADFTTHFTFQILDVSGYEGRNAHGLAFVLLRENATLFSYGPLLGLFESETSALSDDKNNQVVAVEFDTFHNDWDHSMHHIGIDVNSIASKAYTNVTGGFIIKGMESVLVDYNSTTKNLSASLTFAGGSRSYDVSYVVDLSVFLPQRLRVGFTASTLTYVELHQIHSWSFESSIEETFGSPPSSPQGPPSSPPQGKNKEGLVVGISAGVFVVILIAGVALYGFRSRRKALAPNVPLPEDQHEPPNSPWIEHPGPKRFSYVELSEETNAFNDELKLGEGGFGDVYKGVLASTKEKVAIKRFRAGSSQGEKEFVAEVNAISRLRHKNLVQLKGWCHGKEGLLLVYEFMPNRSLDKHLFVEDSVSPLTWPIRYNIALSLASALNYLQNEAGQCVVHRDIKSSNIMLDQDFNAKLGDFGLARLIDHGKRAILSQNRGSLVDWVWDKHTKGTILEEAVDGRVKDTADISDRNEAIRLVMIGLACCHPDARRRPSIEQVKDMLKSEAVDVVDVPRVKPELPGASPGMDHASKGGDNDYGTTYGSSGVESSTTY